MSFSDFLKDNKWCLKQEVLEQLVLDADKNTESVQKTVFQKPGLSELRSEPITVAAFGLPLRSSVSNLIFYEIVLTRSVLGSHVYITALKESKENSRVCVYSNGRIIRWGTWVVELMQTLPSIITQMAKNSVDPEALEATTALHGEDTVLGKFSEIEMELALNWTDENSTTDDVYEKDRSGIPLDFLE